MTRQPVRTLAAARAGARLLLVLSLGALLAGCHGHLHHGHVPPGQAKKLLLHPHVHDYHH